MYSFINLLHYLKSFFIPKTVARPNSDINIKLEVVYRNGRYLLNSEDLNFAYGSLHKAFQKEFRRLNFNKRNFSNVLILGFGVGSIASILHEEYKMDCHITGVEKDNVIIDIGKKYFNTLRFKNIDIIKSDVVEYLSQNTTLFDLIVVDVYIGNDVPPCCETEQFLFDIKKNLSSTGLVVFNKYIYDKKSKETAGILVENFINIFGQVIIHKDNGYMLVHEG